MYLRKKMKHQFVAEEEIKRMAFFDRLTNLPNQELCHNRLEHALAGAARNQHWYRGIIHWYRGF